MSENLNFHSNEVRVLTCHLDRVFPRRDFVFENFGLKCFFQTKNHLVGEVADLFVVSFYSDFSLNYEVEVFGVVVFFINVAFDWHDKLFAVFYELTIVEMAQFFQELEAGDEVVAEFVDLKLLCVLELFDGADMDLEKPRLLRQEIEKPNFLGHYLFHRRKFKSRADNS